MHLNRRSFSAALAASPLVAQQAAQPAAPQATATAARGPQIESALVKDFVAVAHTGRFDDLKAMLEKTPGLLNASWDWGGGDWETALGAAGHVGRKENARMLLEKGARPDVFASIMLGDLTLVKSWLSSNPEAVKVRGPHLIPTLSHAIAGGKESLPVFEALLSAGADVNAVAFNGFTPLIMATMGASKTHVVTLLAKGADPSAVAKDGRTPLSIAKKGNDPEIITLLEKAGAKA